MAITFNALNRIFQLDTEHSTYQMKADEHGVLLHLYYGKKIQGSMEYLIHRTDVGFSGNPYDTGRDRTYSLDMLPQEYPSCGVGDYRNTCIGIVNADGSRAADLRYVSYRIEKGAKKIPGMPALYGREEEADTLTVLLKDLATGLELELYYTVFETLNVIARSCRIINSTGQKVTLEKALTFCLDMPYGDWEMMHFHGRHAMERQMERAPLIHGTLSFGSKRGTSSHQENPAMILCSPDATEEHGECYGMALVYSSNFIADVELDQMNQTRVVMGIHPEYFNYVLEAGEVFDTPQAMLAYSEQGLGTLSHIFHRAIRHHLCRGKYNLARRPVLLNNWEATYFDCTKDKIISIAKQAAELGVEMMVLDDGWFGKRDDDYSGLGDWYVNEEKMGGTLKELAEEINSMGMKFGLWVEPEMISEDSDLYRFHPDWALTIPGRKPNRSRSQLVLDMSREDVRDYLFSCISKILSSANIEYIKWDMNRSMCDMYSVLSGSEHQGEVYHRCVLGVYDLLERLVSTFPDVLLEGCSGGGGRFDPAMLYYSPQYWCSDDTDAVERLEIQYGTSFFYPISTVGAHVSASPNHQTGRHTPIQTRGVVAMAGTFGFELDLNLLTVQERLEVKKQIEDFKKYYDVIQNGSYYRLTSPYDQQAVTSWQFVSEDKTESLVSLVCTHVRANKADAFVKLKGLDESAVYEIDGMERTFSGSALMYGGIAVPVLQGDYPARQLYLKRL